jgi:hypothetical protein
MNHCKDQIREAREVILRALANGQSVEEAYELLPIDSPISSLAWNKACDELIEEGILHC